MLFEIIVGTALGLAVLLFLRERGERKNAEYDYEVVRGQVTVTQEWLTTREKDLAREKKRAEFWATTAEEAITEMDALEEKLRGADAALEFVLEDLDDAEDELEEADDLLDKADELLSKSSDLLQRQEAARDLLQRNLLVIEHILADTNGAAFLRYVSGKRS
jgi:3-hydroxyacyl-CoA dehydrogenase